MVQISPEYKLPHKARGVDAGEFAWEFRPDGKILFIPKDRSKPHFTLHPGHRSGELDLHKTFTDRNGKSVHEPIFRMRREDIPRLLADIESPMLSALVNLYRPLRLGWMSHRRIGIVRGLFPTEEELQTIARRNRRKRLEIDRAAFLRNIEVPEYLDDVLDMPDGTFSLVAMRRRTPKQIGVAFKVTPPSGAPRLVWVKLDDMVNVMKQMADFLMQTAKKYALPPEKPSK